MSDAQNCGKMDILRLRVATLSSFRACRMLKTVVKWTFWTSPSDPFVTSCVLDVENRCFGGGGGGGGGGGVVVVFWWCFCGGVVVWWCFCGGAVVFWCFCGGVFLVVFLWWCFCGGAVVWWCFCGCVVVMFLWWCAGVFAVCCGGGWCSVGGVLVVGGVLLVVFSWCFCGGLFKGVF